jgi:membrane-associated protease RseP (regulator of RpoE activity)
MRRCYSSRVRLAPALLCLAVACGKPARQPVIATPPAAPPPDAAVAQSLGGKTELGLVEQMGDAPKWIGVLFSDKSNQIREVLAASPAARAGLRPGDKILSVAGTPVTGLADVVQVVHSHAVGDTMDVIVERDGVKTTLKVVVEYRPDMQKLQADKLLGKAAPDIKLATVDGKPLRPQGQGRADRLLGHVVQALRGGTAPPAALEHHARPAWSRRGRRHG